MAFWPWVGVARNRSARWKVARIGGTSGRLSDPAPDHRAMVHAIEQARQILRISGSRTQLV
jgi:hypothetical protein